MFLKENKMIIIGKPAKRPNSLLYGKEELPTVAIAAACG